MAYSWDDVKKYLSDTAFGTPSGYQIAATPEQKKAYESLISQGSNRLQNPYEGFDPIAQREITRFQTQTVPSIAERFNAFGGDTRYSSNLGHSLASAGAGLGENLAALRSEYGLQNQTNALNQLNLGLSAPTQYQEGKQGIIPGLAGAGVDYLGELGGAVGDFATGNYGSLIKRGINTVGSLFAPKPQTPTPYAPGYTGPRQAGYQLGGKPFGGPYAPGYTGQMQKGYGGYF